MFGTTSEANSFSVAERRALLEEAVGGGIPSDRLMVGTGCCAFTDSVELTRHALDAGCRRVLMLPPFYYKGMSDEGLFRRHCEVIERVGEPAPQGVSLSLPEALRSAHHRGVDRAAHR